jgi:drug/metabolite transporter (DMT)-like permease
MKSFKGYSLILGATLFWGVSASIAKLLITNNVDTLVLVQMRMTFSCLVLLVFFLLFRRDLLRVRVHDLHHFALLGIIGGAGSNFLYYFTIKEITVATAILLQYLAPLLVLAYAAFSQEEEVTVTKVTAGGVSLFGCYLVLNGENFSLQSVSKIGLVTGILSAGCWGFANVWMRHLVQRYSTWTMLIYSFSFASVFWLFFNPPWNILTAHYSVNEWKTFFLFAMISVLIPHSFYYRGIQYLTASQAIITATAEPVVAIVAAFIILGETLTLLQILGAVFVITAIGLLQFKRDVTHEVLITEAEK